MTDLQRQLSLQTKKLNLGFWDKISHFGIVGFFFFIPFMHSAFHIKDAINGTNISLDNGEVYFLTISAVLGLLFFKLQSGRLKFKEVQTTLTKHELAHVIEKVGAELKWYPIEIGDNRVIAKTHPSFFSGSWGEQITILFDANKILVNSICDPAKACSVVSMGRNKKNVNRLVEEIETANR